MAVLSMIDCRMCCRQRPVCHSASECPPQVCDECQERAKKAEKSCFLEDLSRLTVEQRLAKLEEIVYELQRQEKPFDYNTPIG